MSFFRASRTRYPQTIMQPRREREGKDYATCFWIALRLCSWILFHANAIASRRHTDQTNSWDFWHNERQLRCLHSPHSNSPILQLSLCKNLIKCVWNSLKSKVPCSLPPPVKPTSNIAGQKCPSTPSSLFSTSLITCKWSVGSCWDHQPLSPPLPTGSGDLHKPLFPPSGCRRPLPRRLAAAGPELWWHTGEKLRGGKKVY